MSELISRIDLRFTSGNSIPIERAHITATEWSELRDLETKLAAAEAALGNLLARIHGDGGHYQARHGTDKAVEDADAKIVDLFVQRDALAAITVERDGLLAADVEYDAANRDWEQATSHDSGDISNARWKKIADRFERAIMHRLEVMDGIQSRSAAGTNEEVEK